MKAAILYGSKVKLSRAHMPVMDKIEIDFVQTAKRLIDLYQRKLTRLKAVVAEWEAGEPTLDLFEVNQSNGAHGPAISKITPRVQEHPQKASQWIRFAVDQHPERIANAEIFRTLQSAGAPSNISKARISTALYHLHKHGELEVIEKTPGGATIYRATPRFQSWQQVKRKVSATMTE